MFMNDSRYANEQMFSDIGTYDNILRQWEEDMPRKLVLLSLFYPFSVLHSPLFQYCQPDPHNRNFKVLLEGISLLKSPLS
jgi:hypothetical protein